MFKEFYSLTTLNLSNLNTINVSNMNCMFYNYKNLTYLNLSNFKTNNVTSRWNDYKIISNDFNILNNLWFIIINVSNYNKVIQISFIFYYFILKEENKNKK